MGAAELLADVRVTHNNLSSSILSQCLCYHQYKDKVIDIINSIILVTKHFIMIFTAVIMAVTIMYSLSRILSSQSLSLWFLITIFMTIMLRYQALHNLTVIMITMIIMIIMIILIFMIILIILMMIITTWSVREARQWVMWPRKIVTFQPQFLPNALAQWWWWRSEWRWLMVTMIMMMVLSFCFALQLSLW